MTATPSVAKPHSMTLIKSISGIRGTIGGKPGDGLTPVDVVKFTAAYGTWVKSEGGSKVVIGRDARVSGKMVSNLVSSTLSALGLDVVNIGLSTTPTVEIAVVAEAADGGIILTASHNPGQWNALKLLNHKGEFISDAEGKALLAIAEKSQFDFVAADKLGSVVKKKGYIKDHIQKILRYPMVDARAIKKADFRIVVDAVNSTGGTAVPQLLKSLGVKKIEGINCEPTGKFAHDPEPLPQNLKEISKKISKGKFDLGIVVDPDVDRLVLIQEDGKPFGEEYTLVAVADYMLSRCKEDKTCTVSNLSSSRALRDLTEAYGHAWHPAAVGEVNVVAKMKEKGAFIGGEGNGGIIVPDFHYGRDALIGIALVLTHLALTGKRLSALKAEYPSYQISKNKIELKDGVDTTAILEKIKEKYSSESINLTDGVRIDFESARSWVHLRRSNTEPIIRIIAEAPTSAAAEKLAGDLMSEIKKISR